MAVEPPKAVSGHNFPETGGAERSGAGREGVWKRGAMSGHKFTPLFGRVDDIIYRGSTLFFAFRGNCFINNTKTNLVFVKHLLRSASLVELGWPYILFLKIRFRADY